MTVDNMFVDKMTLDMGCVVEMIVDNKSVEE
jgi:hypothetical protein